ncbi:hypothetical protein Pcinc_041862 [Petrolisthes cinctipes]|uniref:BTB domain-containing protein n=1 Tax=Petrolisthes cinctipes TaxID=88211 RepID=A0AAE1BJE3_PETCI|nr:hypothetical protein Pcinc_041862 [Petrolisthes cinctipes]
MGSSNGEQQHHHQQQQHQQHQHHQHHQQHQHQHHHHQQQQQDDKKQTYNLCWNEFPTNLLTFFKELREQEEFVDVTLACEGQQVAAHKVVLSACSPYFRSLLKNNPCNHPIIILNEVGYSELVTLLQYMYHGEVQIAHDQITDFLRTAKLLQVRGLAEAAAAESRSRGSSGECRSSRENGPVRDTANTPTPKVEAPDPDDDVVRPPDSPSPPPPQVKRIKLSSSVGPQPPSSPPLVCQGVPLVPLHPRRPYPVCL